MNEENKELLRESELQYRGHLDYFEDNVSEIERFIKDHSAGRTDINIRSMERNLVDLIINVR